MQTEFQTLLPTLIQAPLVCFSKKRLFEEVAECAGHIILTDSDKIISALNEREKLGSTVFANGIAMPHALIKEAQESFAILSLLAEPISFHTIDTNANSIDIAYCFFLSPKDDYERIQNLLIKITEVFSDSSLLTSLRLSRYDENKTMQILQKVDLLLSKPKEDNIVN